METLVASVNCFPDCRFLFLPITLADGHLYTWGRGFGDTLSAQTPQRLPTSFCFTKIALGWNHALVLTGMCIYFMF